MELPTVYVESEPEQSDREPEPINIYWCMYINSLSYFK